MARRTFGGWSTWAVALAGLSVVALSCAGGTDSGTHDGDRRASAPPSRGAIEVVLGEGSGATGASRELHRVARKSDTVSFLERASSPPRPPSPALPYLNPRGKPRGAAVARGASESTPPVVPPPALAASFDALRDNGSGIAPPDTDGAPGPTQLFVAMNSQIVVQNKSGAAVAPASTMNQFFASLLGANEFTSDPHVVFDPYGQRWIFVAISFVVDLFTGIPTQGSILLATSNTTDATGTWYMVKVPVDSNTALIGDFPVLGFNMSWISVSVNMFDVGANQFLGTKEFVFDKAAQYAGTGNGAHTLFSTNGTAPNDDATICGVWTFDPALSTLYMLEDYDGTKQTLRLFSITGPVGAEQMNRLPDVVVSGLSTWADAPPGGAINFVPQLGSSTLIAADDSRIATALFRNGTLWAANNAFLPSSAPTHVGAQWFQIEPTSSSIVQAGRIEDPTANGTTGLHYFFPSINVNKSNDAFFGFSVGGISIYASAAYSMRFGWDAPGTMRDPTTYKAGLAPYDITSFFNPNNRWGDFSVTTVDPVDDMTMWTVEEYAETPANTWGTWWAELATGCTGKADGTQCDDGNLCTGGPKTCMAGVCQGGSPIVCNTPPDSCHSATGTCDPATGLCSYAPSPNGTTCTPSVPDLCFLTYTCQSAVCTGSNPVVCDMPPTTCFSATGTCTPASGQCVYTELPNGTMCPGGTCSNGICVASDAGTDGGPTDSGVDSGTIVDSGIDSGIVVDSGIDSGTVVDSGTDSGTVVDSGTDTGTAIDSGVVVDSGAGADSGADSGTIVDSGTRDSGAPRDSGTGSDSGLRSSDSGSRIDSGALADGSSEEGGAGGGSGDTGGCGCKVAQPGAPTNAPLLSLFAGMGLVAALRSRRRRRSRHPVN